MTSLTKEAIAPFITLAVHLIITRIERRGYKGAINDHRQKRRPQAGFRTKDAEK